MIPWELLKADEVQVVVLLLLLAWIGWLSSVVIKHGTAITELGASMREINTLLTNHHHTLPDRVKEIEERLGIKRDSD